MKFTYSLFEPALLSALPGLKKRSPKDKDLHENTIHAKPTLSATRPKSTKRHKLWQRPKPATVTPSPDAKRTTIAITSFSKDHHLSSVPKKVRAFCKRMFRKDKAFSLSPPDILSSPLETTPMTGSSMTLDRSAIMSDHPIPMMSLLDELEQVHSPSSHDDYDYVDVPRASFIVPLPNLTENTDDSPLHYIDENVNGCLPNWQVSHSPTYSLGSLDAFPDSFRRESWLTQSSAASTDDVLELTTPGTSLHTRPSMEVISSWPKSQFELPPEIWHQIFDYCIPKPVIGGPHLPLRSRDAPFVLQRVHKSWNASVIGTPKLWQSFSARIPTEADASFRADLQRIKRTIARVPLDPDSKLFFSTFIQLKGHGMGKWSDACLEALGAISSIIPQSKAIQIHVPFYMSTLDLETNFLGLMVPDDITLVPVQFSEDTKYASNLRHFSWAGLDSIHTPLRPELKLPWVTLRDVPWQQLQILVLNCPLSLVDCIDVLSMCEENLETATFDDIGCVEWNLSENQEYALVSTGVRRLTKLQSLTIKSSVDLATLFSAFAMNALKHIDLRLSVSDPVITKLHDLSLSWPTMTSIALHHAMTLYDVWILLNMCRDLVSFKWWDQGRNSVSLINPGLNTSAGSTIFDSLALHCLQDVTIATSVDVDPLMDALHDSLQLQVINLPCITPSLSMTQIGDINHFTSVILTCPVNMEECWIILQCSYSLQSLDVHLTKADSVADITHVVESALTSLTIYSSVDPKPLLNNLRLPELISLRLSLSTIGDHSGLSSLFSRSSCNLEKLALENTNISANDFIVCLELVSQSLKELDVTASAFQTSDTEQMLSGDVLRRLSHRNCRAESHCLCPFLKVLRLSPCCAEDGLFADMIESRCRDRRDQECPNDACVPSPRLRGFASLDIVGYAFSEGNHTIDTHRIGLLREKGLLIHTLEY